MARYKVARGNTRKLLIVIGNLQSMIGRAWNYHQNDRDPNGFEKGQATLEEALKLCVETTGLYAPVEEASEAPKTLSPRQVAALKRLAQEAKRTPDYPWRLPDAIGVFAQTIEALAWRGLVDKQPGAYSYYKINDAGRQVLREVSDEPPA